MCAFSVLEKKADHIIRYTNEFDYETFLRACALIIKVSKTHD